MQSCVVYQWAEMCHEVSLNIFLFSHDGNGKVLLSGILIKSIEMLHVLHKLCACL